MDRFERMSSVFEVWFLYWNDICFDLTCCFMQMADQNQRRSQHRWTKFGTKLNVSEKCSLNWGITKIIFFIFLASKINLGLIFLFNIIFWLWSWALFFDSRSKLSFIWSSLQNIKRQTLIRTGLITSALFAVASETKITEFFHWTGTSGNDYINAKGEGPKSKICVISKYISNRSCTNVVCMEY